MVLKTEEDIKKVWGSHLPLVQAVIEVFQPQSAVECGCGNYSTPVLSKIKKLISIEHDIKWGKKIAKQYPDVEFIMDEIPLVERRFLKPGKLEEIEQLYESYAKGLAHFDLLFVDTVACGRVVSFNALRHLAQWIIVHDSDPASCLHYNYNLLNTTGLFHYRLMPEGNVNGHKLEWTSFFTREPIAIKKLKKVIDKYAEELWGFTSIFEKVEND